MGCTYLNRMQGLSTSPRMPCVSPYPRTLDFLRDVPCCGYYSHILPLWLGLQVLAGFKESFHFQQCTTTLTRSAITISSYHPRILGVSCCVMFQQDALVLVARSASLGGSFLLHFDHLEEIMCPAIVWVLLQNGLVLFGCFVPHFEHPVS